MKIQTPTEQDEGDPGYNIINLSGSTPLVLCMAAFRDPGIEDHDALLPDCPQPGYVKLYFDNQQYSPFKIKYLIFFFQMDANFSDFSSFFFIVLRIPR